jgi:protein phosphatase 2C-like protein
LKLVGAVTQGSGSINEDGWGFVGNADDVTAAWVFDGVTGINGRNLFPAGSDAAWIVAKAHSHLLKLAGLGLPLRDILSKLVQALIIDFNTAVEGLDIPHDYDPPAACLILVKRYGAEWKALRLGDSCLLARGNGGANTILAASPNNAFDHWLSTEAAKRRDAGVLDIKALHAEFRPQLLQGRKLRNTSGGYSILEANPSATEFAEYLDLGTPEELLLCTDGYYRAVDHYALHSDKSLLKASSKADGLDRVLRDIRALEEGDPACQKYLRFKPADDATALVLRERA